jgi:hypothetical protein
VLYWQLDATAIAVFEVTAQVMLFIVPNHAQRHKLLVLEV